MLFIFSDAGSERELVNPCCQFGEPPHFKYFYNRVYINKLKFSISDFFFRKCKQKSNGNIHTQLQKMPNNIFFKLKQGT